jgi:NADPH:quinone reductase-like Zn-dependent oxidoreductase
MFLLRAACAPRALRVNPDCVAACPRRVKYCTEEKLVILGAAGAIGSNLVQAALTWA